MSLLDIIKRDLTEARKAKNVLTSSILSTLYAEACMVGKNDGNRRTTDAEVGAKVKTFIKNIDETLKALSEEHTQGDDLKKERVLLKKYLPNQMDEKKLKIVIAEIGSNYEKSPKSMGKIMSELKSQYEGSYEGKLASTLVKEFLSI